MLEQRSFQERKSSVNDIQNQPQVPKSNIQRNWSILVAKRCEEKLANLSALIIKKMIRQRGMQNYQKFLSSHLSENSISAAKNLEIFRELQYLIAFPVSCGTGPAVGAVRDWRKWRKSLSTWIGVAGNFEVKRFVLHVREEMDELFQEMQLSNFEAEKENAFQKPKQKLFK